MVGLPFPRKAHGRPTIPFRLYLNRRIKPTMLCLCEQAEIDALSRSQVQISPGDIDRITHHLTEPLFNG